MPPRKIDPAKRGDVSMAQFVYNGEASQSEPATAVPSHLKHTTSSISTPATHMETDDLEPSQLADKERDKDKDKERDRKDKDKDKDKDRDNSKDVVTIEDLTLPKSIITRLAKGVLPSNTQIQANAILAMSKSATVFINHLANAANEHTLNNNKKTIMPGDVFAALDDIEFPFFRERLEAEFKKFNDTQTSKRNTYRRKVAAQKKAKDGPGAGDPNTSMISTASAATDPDPAPRSKKQKPNAAHEESAMDLDGDETQEPRDASDADTEPEQEHEEDDEDDEDHDNAEEEDEDDDEEENEDEIHDRLEPRQNREDEDDDALDNDGDSD
ncbi:hypothetical protein NUW58_g7394 [Xylaria curta]|uniref:Uncharacterized protein n=1 Tax=Xylaria curta TaxID=42375 RepID=A0ACC1NIK0_9PEZI|nr:hypothetical protein NUW58_g7394 [Xylaria curta]